VRAVSCEPLAAGSLSAREALGPLFVDLDEVDSWSREGSNGSAPSWTRQASSSSFFSAAGEADDQCEPLRLPPNDAKLAVADEALLAEMPKLDAESTVVEENTSGRMFGPKNASEGNAKLGAEKRKKDSTSAPPVQHSKRSSRSVSCYGALPTAPQSAVTPLAKKRSSSRQSHRSSRKLHEEHRKKKHSDDASSAAAVSPVKIGKLLCEAAGSGNADLVSDCLVKGADPNFVNAGGLCPLQIACTQGQLQILKLLCEASADVNQPLKASKTAIGVTSALHVAAKYGHELVVRFLLEARSEVRKRNGSHLLPVDLAEKNGHEDVVKLLVQHAAQGKERRRSLIQLSDAGFTTENYWASKTRSASK